MRHLLLPLPAVGGLVSMRKEKPPRMLLFLPLHQSPTPLTLFVLSCSVIQEATALLPLEIGASAM